MGDGLNKQWGVADPANPFVQFRSIPMSNKLTLSKMVDGQFVAVGNLTFDPAGKAVLTVQDRGPVGAELRAAWSEVSALPAIRMKWSELDPSDKSGATQLLKGRDVPRGDPDYAKAVADILSRKFGFFGTPSPLD